MYQIDNPSAVAALPAPAAAGVPGYFSDGDAVGGEAATVLPADFMNMLMMELLSILQAAGIQPSKASYNQVVSAINILIARAAPPVGNYAPLPTSDGSAVGAFLSLIVGSGTLTLPPGGTWVYFFSNNNTGGLGVAAGGTVVFSGVINNEASFCWRIA